MLTKPELLTLLDREVDHVYRQSHRPGWTPWALLTAFAALLWGAASRIEHVTSPTIVFQSAAIALMVIDVLRRGRRLLDLSRSSDDEGRVLVSSDVLGVDRPALALELIYAVALLWGLGVVGHEVALWPRVSASLWAVLMGLFALIGLLYSVWPVPFPVGLAITSPVRLLLQVPPILLPALGAFGYIGVVVGNGVEDVRVGVLLGSAALVLLEMARQPDEPPLVGELVELRRGLSLGTLAVAEAVPRATIILRGLKLEDYVQQDARRMLRAMESLQSATTNFRPVVDEINRQATLLENKTAPDGQAWERLMAEWEQKGDQATARFNRAERWQRRYARRLEFAAVVARLWHLPYEGQALMAEIRPRVELVTSEYKDVVDQYGVALKRLEQALREAGLLK